MPSKRLDLKTLYVITDFICPWCYIGEAYLKTALQQQSCNVEYIFFPLHPDTPAGGLSLEELFAGRHIDINKTQREIRSIAEKAGLPYGERTQTFNSFNAQVIGKQMIEVGKFTQYKDAVFRAYFGNGENIGDIQVLQRITDSIEDGRWDVEKVVNDPDYCQQVHDDWLLTREMGITGVPAYCYNNRYCVGAQSSTNLLALYSDQPT